MDNVQAFANPNEMTAEEVAKLHDAIMEKDEDGLSTGLIKVCMEQLHNVKEGEINDIKDSDRELIRDMDLLNVSIDMYTNDVLGRKWFVAFTFDTEFSQEKKDFEELVGMYQDLCKTKATEEDMGIDSPIPMFGITMIPYSLNGEYYAHFAFPENVEYVTEDNGMWKTAILTFSFDNMDYARNELSEEERSEIEADVLRDFEDKENGGASGSGNIFEE